MKASAIALLLLSGLLLAACFDLDGGEEPSGTPNATASPQATPGEPVSGGPEEAIATYARDVIGQEYTGDCAAARLPDDLNKLCAALRDERDGTRAYIAGLAFSEFFAWLFVAQQEGRWQVVGRFDIHEEAAGVPGTPWPLVEGAEVVVTGTGDALNVREGPGLKAPAVDALPDGTKVVLAQGPVEADGFQWWRVEGRAGWVAADWLRYPDEAAPAPAQ